MPASDNFHKSLKAGAFCHAIFPPVPPMVRCRSCLRRAQLNNAAKFGQPRRWHERECAPGTVKTSPVFALAWLSGFRKSHPFERGP